MNKTFKKVKKVTEFDVYVLELSEQEAVFLGKLLGQTCSSGDLGEFYFSLSEDIKDKYGKKLLELPEIVKHLGKEKEGELFKKLEEMGVSNLK